MRKNVKRNGLFGPDDRLSHIKNKGYYQLYILGGVLAVLGVIGALVYFIVIPMIAKEFADEGPTVVKDTQNIGMEVVQRENLYSLVNEHLFRIRYINHPQMYGNELICSGGSDTAGNPLLVRTYLYSFNGGNSGEITDLEIKAVNANIFYPQLSEKYIAYVDAKANGGGSIFCYDRKTGKSKEVKEFYGAAPELHLTQNRIVWFEQVTGKLASIYVYDILLDKLATVETQYDLPFVYGRIGVDENKVIWPTLSDGETSIGQLKNSGKNTLTILDLGNGAKERYYPDTYAYSPQIKGNIIGWLDTNNSPASNLYISVDRGEKKHLAFGVTNYYIGDGYVIYCQNERMYCYFVAKDLTLPLSKEDKRTMMIGGKNGVVFWYDITQSYERDIVKYAKVDANSWQE